MPLGAPFGGRKPWLWGDLEKGLEEPCSTSVHLALAGVISMYLMSAGRKRRLLMIQCSSKVRYTPLCSSPCSFWLRFTIPRGCRGAAPSPHITGLPLREAQTNAGLRGDPMRADLCPDTQPWCPTQVLAGCRRGYVRPRLPVQLPPRRERTLALAETCRGWRVFPPAAAPFVPDSREKHLAAPRGDIRLGGARPAWPCSPMESSEASLCGGDGVGWLAGLAARLLAPLLAFV